MDNGSDALTLATFRKIRMKVGGKIYGSIWRMKTGVPGCRWGHGYKVTCRRGTKLYLRRTIYGTNPPRGMSVVVPCEYLLRDWELADKEEKA